MQTSKQYTTLNTNTNKQNTQITQNQSKKRNLNYKTKSTVNTINNPHILHATNNKQQGNHNITIPVRITTTITKQVSTNPKLNYQITTDAS